MSLGKVATRYLKWAAEAGRFEVAKIAIAGPAEGETLLRVLATCVNRADILEKKGKYKAVSNSDVLGIEVVGIEVDPATLEPTGKRGLVGGLVRGGGYAEFAVVNRDHLIPFGEALGDTLSPVECGAIPEAFLTAFQLLEYYGRPAEGEWVYVPAGAGGVGTAAIQLAKQLFKARVVASCSSEEKAQFCRSFGADLVVLHADKPLETLTAEIVAGVGPQGVNCILDCIGPSHAEFHGKLIAEDGRWVVYGLLGGSGASTSQGLLNALLYKRVTLTGSLLRNRSDEYKAQLTSAFNSRVLPLFREGRLRPVVGNRFKVTWETGDATPMDAAHGVVEGNGTRGRVVVTFEECCK